MTPMPHGLSGRIGAAAHGEWKPATLHTVPAHVWTDIAPGVRILVDAGHAVGMSVQTFTAVDGCAPDCVHAVDAWPAPCCGAESGQPHTGDCRADLAHPCANGCTDPARHAEGGHDV